MNWWKNVVVYQIYPKSFKDTNNDGIGDLKGIEEKIPYLNQLGVGAIWISPFFLSPMVDNGYDVQDYKKINPIFGTMEDFDNLKKTCDKYNIKIIVDFVANHTSDKHEWFQKALKNEEKYKDYYVFTKDPIWEKKSVFGGEAWEKINNDEYYLHSFAVNQPDLNWENPNVRKEFKEIMNFWIDKGIGGVRFDVIDDIGKNLDRDLIKKGIYIDIEKLHSFVKEWRNESKWNQEDLLTVGESWDSSTDKAILYTNPERKELAMVFGFEHIMSNWNNKPKWEADKLDLVKYKKIISKWQKEIHNNGWLALFMSNHDLPRMISNFGDEKYRIESGKSLALVLHMLQGTPFVYQGEEIGMLNCKFNNLEEHDDIEIHQMYESIKKENDDYTKDQHLQYVAKMNRDNARTPMQWNKDLNAGFTNGKPWLKINENYKEINVEDALKDSDSLFYWYQKLINFRKDLTNPISNVIINGDFELIDSENEKIFAYKRQYNNEELIVISNWSSDKVEFKFNKENIILNNYDYINDNLLEPWQSILIFIKK
ncbi:MAG: alpha-glucosidase [Mycoplasmataceae bacterium]|nr:alpha-glucosidase [Mycoplasmataceae bacterium]